MAPPTTSTIVLPSLSEIEKHTITCLTPKQHMPGPYKAFNAAIDTTQASGSKLTIQMVKTLEQHIIDAYLKSLWHKVSYISDVEDSDIKMHALEGKDVTVRPRCRLNSYSGSVADRYGPLLSSRLERLSRVVTGSVTCRKSCKVMGSITCCVT